MVSFLLNGKSEFKDGCSLPVNSTARAVDGVENGARNADRNADRAAHL